MLYRSSQMRCHHGREGAFDGVTFSSEDSKHHWRITLPPGYAASRDELQRQQVIKAGARLAQLLRELFP